MELGKKIGVAIIGIVIIVLAVYLALGGKATEPQQGSDVSIPGGVVPGNNPVSKPENAGEADVNANTTNTNTNDNSWIPKIAPASKIEIDKLQALLDNEATHDEAVEQAVKMAHQGDGDQILAALDAFRWLGGREVKVTLVELIKRGGDIAARATETLQSVFQTDVIDDERPFDEDVWIDAFKALSDEAEREAFLVLLTSNPVEISAPTLIKLWNESEDTSVKSMVREYFESIAEGIDIVDPEAAQKWFDDYKAEQEKKPVEADTE